MKYTLKLILRILILIIFPFTLFQILITKITIYPIFLFLKLFQPTFLIDNFIFFNETIVQFIPACAAALAYYLLLALILTTKDISFKKRIKIFLIGSLIIFIVNFIRTTSLILILHYFNRNFFNSIHLFFWSFTGSVLVVLIWIFLIKMYNINSIPVYSDLKYLLKKIKVFK